MVSSTLGAALGAAALFAGSSLAAVDPILAKGQHFFFSGNGSQFFIRGVAYQQGVNVNANGDATVSDQHLNDPLADSTSCKRDIPYLQQLGTNTIRVYAIDPTKDHTTCMNALADAGIYVIADLSSPDVSVERDSPAWTTDLYTRYTSVIDNLGPFQNTLGFFAGNEVTNNNTNTAASAYIKAAVRDSKAYIKSKNFGRWLGVGYATNDDGDTRNNLANYFNCGDSADSVDFWGYNIYEWCGQSTFESSGYQERTKFFQDYSVPAFFSEYGCNNPGGGESRVFQETGVLYSDQMNKVWSGGIVYEFFQEQNDYGLVSVSGSSVATRKDFGPLATQIAKSGYPDTGLTSNSYTPSNTARACPAIETSTTSANRWQAAEVLPPTPNATVCECMYSTLSCVPSSKLASNATALGSLFGTVCGLSKDACTEISGDTTTGKYGIYSGCNATQKIAHALDTYYKGQKQAQTACDFGGMASIKSANSATECSAVLASASAGTTTGGSGGDKSGAAGVTGFGAAAAAGSVLLSMVVGAAVLL